MTVIFDFSAATALSARLRSNGIYSVIRSEISAPELDLADTAIITRENASLIPKLKNAHEDIRALYLSSDAKAPMFCDVHAATTDELLSLFPPVNSLTIACGIAIDANVRSAEKCSKEIKLTPSELDVLRCIAISAAPLSASLLSELALGEKNPHLLMTHVSNINRKARETFGKKLIESEKARGYIIV